MKNPRLARPDESFVIGPVFATVLLSLFCLVFGGCGADATECIEGTFNCPCMDGDICDGGLICVDGVCLHGDDPDGSVIQDGGDGGELDPGEWRLPENHYIPGKMSMTVVHPREGEAAEWAYAKNAHPNVRWEIPIVVQGGAWPFRYEILENGGAEGLEIGGELRREKLDGYVFHRVNPEYGVLWWDDPQEGFYEILVRVEDQDANTVDVVVSLTVGVEGWVFVDPANGDDENVGTIDDPFRTVGRVVEEGAGFANHRVYLHGLVPMDGNRENGNLRIEEGLAPRVWVGFPGSGAVLEAYEGKLVLASADFYFANLEHRHREDFYQQDGSFIHMITVWGDHPRYTVHDVTFSRFQGDPVNTDLGNSSIMMFTNPDSPRDYVAVVNCTQTGPNGLLTSTYFLRYSVFEKNRVKNADISLADGSVWSVIFVKGGNNEFLTLRANEFWEENEWNAGSGALGLMAARNIEFAYNVINTPWSAGRRGAMVFWTNSPLADYSWTEDTPVWVYRNSFKERLHWEAEALVNMPDGTVIMERNVLDTGDWPLSERLQNIENLDGASYFDEEMRLTAEAREYLGRYGAEIAVEEP